VRAGGFGLGGDGRGRRHSDGGERVEGSDGGLRAAARKILEEAAEIDAVEDELYGDKRGDELPEQLTTGKRRQEWLREARRQLEAERAASPKPVPRARPPRLKEAKRRLQEELWAEQRANAGYEAWRATAKDTLGRGLGAPPTPYTPPELPAGTVNLADPDSRRVQSRRGFMQGYTAQAVATRNRSWSPPTGSREGTNGKHSSR
jgi:hypothetical protein